MHCQITLQKVLFSLHLHWPCVSASFPTPSPALDIISLSLSCQFLPVPQEKTISCYFLKICVCCITNKTEYLFKYLAVCIFSVICLCPFFSLGSVFFFFLVVYECFAYYGHLSFHLLKKLKTFVSTLIFLSFYFYIFRFVLVHLYIHLEYSKICFSLMLTFYFLFWILFGIWHFNLMHSF